MSKRFTYLIAALLLSAVVSHAQETGEPSFVTLDNELRTEAHRWSGDKQSLARIFNDERRRLGNRFESELLKWLGNDPEKHYWISSFINWESYLQGNERLPQLSLLIKQQGLTLVQNKDDDESRGYVIGLSMTAAILSDELGFRPLASFYKTQAEDLLRRDPSLRSYIPALSEAERRRYDEIRSPIRRGVTTVLGISPNPADDTNPPPPHAQISGGILNGKALKLPKPIYPLEAREVFASGVVVVRVVIDETGKVIYAKVISGHPKLWKAAEEAALQSEFSPTKLSGVPVKVTGVIQYNFVARR